MFGRTLDDHVDNNSSFGDSFKNVGSKSGLVGNTTDRNQPLSFVTFRFFECQVFIDRQFQFLAKCFAVNVSVGCFS